MKVNYAPQQGRTTSFIPGQPVAPPVSAPPVAPADNGLQPLQQPLLVPQFEDLDPINQRQDLARSIMTRGMSDAPVVSPLAGLARMGQALIGGIMLNKSNEALKSAKQSNKDLLKNAFDEGDVSTLLTSGDPVGEKLGEIITQAQLKRQGGPRLLTTEEKTAKGIDPTKIVQYDPNDGFKFLDNEKPMTSQGMISYDRGKTWSKIEGYTDMAKELHNARTTPKANTDQSGKAPWERKW